MKRVLTDLGVFSVKISKAQESGYPDREFLLPEGRPFFIEFKAPGRKPTKRQLLVHERLRYLGYDVEVHDNVDRAVAAVASRLRAAAGPGVAVLPAGRGAAVRPGAR
jgi:hypothetical protein